MRMPELKALTREHRLRGCSQLKKAELIAFLQDNAPQEPQAPRRQIPPPPPLWSWAPSGLPQMTTWDPRGVPGPAGPWEPIDDRLRQFELEEAPLTKIQLKRRRNKDSKLAMEFKRLEADIDNLKSQMGALKDKITKVSESTNARFKRKKIRSMKREADKISEKLVASEAKLESVEQRVPRYPIRGASLKLHPLNRSKRIETKIAELNKKIRRARHKRNKECLIAKREALRAELNWGPRQLGAFGGAYRRYRRDGMPGTDPDTFFNRIRSFLIDLLKKESRTGAVRAQTETWIRFSKDNELVELAFNSRMMNVYNISNPGEIVNEIIAHMKQQIENPALLNSRFVFDEVLYIDVDFHELNLMRGSSYLPLPEWLARKKAIIKPRNKDQECFKWAVITASRWEEINNNPERISKLARFEADFDWSGIGFPVSIKDIKKFELRNQISLNLLAIEDRQIYICRKGGNNYERVINLMLITESNRKHYVSIKSLSRLLRSQNTKLKGKEYFLMNCLQGFWEEKSRNEHVGYCKDNESVRIEMPHKKPVVEYSDEQFQFKVPFIMYADFESILELISRPGNNPRISTTRGINVHVPSGWCICSKFAYGEVKAPLALYRGKDCVQKFCDHIIGEARRLYKSFPEKPMEPLTKVQWKDYKKVSSCHICLKPFIEGNPKVRDHCHYSGIYRGVAHSLCNLQYKIPSYIPVVFHNLSGYDAHMFIKELASSSPNGAKMGVIA